MLMDRPSIKRIASACVITVTLLCILLIKADFIAARYSEYHNSVTEASYEPVDIDKIKETSSYRIVPPSRNNCRNHKISLYERKVSVLHDALIAIVNEIKNSDTFQLLSILAENNRIIQYNVIICLGRYIS